MNDHKQTDVYYKYGYIKGNMKMKFLLLFYACTRINCKDGSMKI